MGPEVGKELAAYFFTQGVLGVATLLLICVVIHLWKKLDAERLAWRTELASLRDAHKIEVAAKDALIEELHDDILKEARTGFDNSRSTQATLDAFIATIRGRGAA
ncbi:MAG: hypothetical protein DI629_12015 [Mesorhizobium amorphae]|nr:MAG: hypothetical protein DI629_12015 [Mesorhizobium amorphae]